AINDALIRAESSTVATAEGGGSASFQITNNTIGWERGNLLFNSLETLLGDVVHNVSEPLGEGQIAARAENPFVVEASISDSHVVAGGTVAVHAQNEASILSSIDNEASGSVTALFD